ncbi:MAG: 4-hydroxythreonine-4-phosphate dehydrogenase PdxA [Proteobacteria bacterium]|jgi:4-hydroxythreonine-4-phosphate dehydrogenase|nr:4-hydroxythreonine-4-phosphate dehydrogenase PdxA [Pseudomonadota bacterium]
MIGVTLGEYFGIGPEIFLKTYRSLGTQFPSCKIYGSERLLEQKAKELGIETFWKNSNQFVMREAAFGVIEKKDFKSRADYVIRTLDAAIHDANDKHITGIVTCPIDKSVVKHVIPDFTGHTEYLAEKSGAGKTVMMLCNLEYNIALLSNHVSLRHVSQALSFDSVEHTIRTAMTSFSKHFDTNHPKAAVLGVNPHAGELDPESEETRVFRPLLQKLQNEGMDIHGLFPADSFFPKAKQSGWDIVFSPYHDQGLVAAKYAGLEHVINVTLGMPYLRISPGHGTAYDIVDKNIADHRSFERAITTLQRKSLV